MTEDEKKELEELKPRVYTKMGKLRTNVDPDELSRVNTLLQLEGDEVDATADIEPLEPDEFEDALFLEEKAATPRHLKMATATEMRLLSTYRKRYSRKQQKQVEDHLRNHRSPNGKLPEPLPTNGLPWT